MKQTNRASETALILTNSAEVIAHTAKGANALKQGSNKAVELFKEQNPKWNRSSEFYPIDEDGFFVIGYFNTDAQCSDSYRNKYYIMRWNIENSGFVEPWWDFKGQDLLHKQFDTIEEARDFVEKLINE